MIRPMQYCEVVGRRKAKSDNISVGQWVLVVAMKAFPDSHEDPYMQRIFAICIKVDKDGTHHMPSRDNEHKTYVVDPRMLNRLSDEDNKRLTDIYVEAL